MIHGLRRVILFDGDCLTCNRVLTFIAARLPHEIELAFVPLESTLTTELLVFHPKLRERDAVIYLDDYALLHGAAAVERVLSFIPRWRIAGQVLAVLPNALAESAYDVFASNRYRWNKRLTACEIPSAQLSARLVG
ncbi:MAG: DUF393 domain-containing protein [Actinomycetota bacterium]|nr:DUF393 domain-containing protein [Actinomycetota bacterium]